MLSGMTPETAMRQAWKTAAEYADNTLEQLCLALNIDRRKDPADWRVELAPFACVWAAMIASATEDFRIAVENGEPTD